MSGYAVGAPGSVLFGRQGLVGIAAWLETGVSNACAASTLFAVMGGVGYALEQSGLVAACSGQLDGWSTLDRGAGMVEGGADGEQFLLQVAAGHGSLGEGDAIVMDHGGVDHFRAGQGEDGEQLLIEGGELAALAAQLLALGVDLRRGDLCRPLQDMQHAPFEIEVGGGYLHEELRHIDNFCRRAEAVVKWFHGGAAG